MIDVVIEDPRWTQLGLRDLARDSVSATLDAVQVSAPFELSVLGCDDARIAALNTEFRGKPEPTNVLSWPETDLSAEKDGDLPQAPVPTPDGVLGLGDIAIAYETCVREAAEQGKPPEHHVAHLLVHGTLHLLGYDHIRDRDATRMEALEVKLLGILGVPDPY
ncbi:MAG: rRNA maturation RNase YbeY [Pseudomonadota bacterium]